MRTPSDRCSAAVQIVHLSERMRNELHEFAAAASRWLEGLHGMEGELPTSCDVTRSTSRAGRAPADTAQNAPDMRAKDLRRALMNPEGASGECAKAATAMGDSAQICSDCSHSPSTTTPFLGHFSRLHGTPSSSLLERLRSLTDVPGMTMSSGLSGVMKIQRGRCG